MVNLFLVFRRWAAAKLGWSFASMFRTGSCAKVAPQNTIAIIITANTTLDHYFLLSLATAAFAQHSFFAGHSLNLSGKTERMPEKVHEHWVF
jgi:hypothetical protein